MNRIFLLIFLIFFVSVSSRPSPSEESNESQEEAEYEEENGSNAEDNLDDSQFGDEDPNTQDMEKSRRLQELNRNNYLQKNLAEEQLPRTSVETPECKSPKSRGVRRNDGLANNNNNEDFQGYGKRRRYIENSDVNEQSEIAQHLTNHDVKQASNRFHNELILENPVKRNFELSKAPTEETELLFENSRDGSSKVLASDRAQRSELNEQVESNQLASYPKQHLNRMQPDKNALEMNGRDNDFFYYNRDRRDTKLSNQGADTESNSNNNSGIESLEKLNSENEEMAIKRHIKKMSGDELERLLNSLSEEKKVLLKKIMDEDDMSEKLVDSINKREITKKDGALEDTNSFMDNGQSESIKSQSVSSFDVTAAYPSSAELDISTIKQPEVQSETTILMNTKPSPVTTSENKAELNTNNDKMDNSFVPDASSIKNSADIIADDQAISKNENKRETNTEIAFESLEGSKPKSNNVNEFQSDDSYFSSQDGDMSQFLDDMEQSRSDGSSKIYKREVGDPSQTDSKFKSLEESFPNSDAYDESGPYSGPLIRVKRKNTDTVVKKRSAALLPEAKVGYLPSRSDTIDDDSEEGNEFDDDGFYDPAPNLVSMDNKNLESASINARYRLDAKEQAKTSLNDGTINLGSDTDTVLSGVEGVDENLMYNNAFRNRRKTAGDFVERVEGNSLNQSEQSKSAVTESNSDSGLNIPHYQDSDSFGGFPRSYEGDLNRYKRVRRLKQSNIAEASHVA